MQRARGDARSKQAIKFGGATARCVEVGADHGVDGGVHRQIARNMFLQQFDGRHLAQGQPVDLRARGRKDVGRLRHAARQSPIDCVSHLRTFVTPT